MRKPQSSVYSWPAIERIIRIHRLIENKEYPKCTRVGVLWNLARFSAGGRQRD
jgi:hypothetical protein